MPTRPADRGPTVTVALRKDLHRQLAHLAVDREEPLSTLLDTAVERYLAAPTPTRVKPRRVRGEETE